jgi:hypothetical protein
MSPHARRLRLQHWNIERPRKLKAGYRDPGDGMFTELVFYLLTIFLFSTSMWFAVNLLF